MKKLIVSGLVFLIFSCNVTPQKKGTLNGYDLSKPDAKVLLPAILHEISGIAYINDSTLACVQDELGVVYYFDLNKKEIVMQFPFHDAGDFEDVAYDGTYLYVLRSDGRLFKFLPSQDGDAGVKIFETGIPAKNNEGLYFDARQKHLLIGCKSKTGKKDGSRDVYCFDVLSEKLSALPCISFDIKQIRQKAAATGIQLPPKIKKDGSSSQHEIKMKISALARNPLTGQLYILSAAEHLLFICDASDKVKDIVQLDATLFNKAEGIAFDPRGNLYISNEGGEGQASLLKFYYKAP